MAVNDVRNIAPFINKTFTITSPWWTERINPITGKKQIHRGLDISTGRLGSEVYSMLNGVVHSLGYDSSRGNWIIIWDNNEESLTYGYATLYMHLKAKPLLAKGTPVSVGQYIGQEGSTGASTGTHLHVEMQDISRFDNKWHTSNNKDDYLNVPDFMGIDNIKNTQWIYNGEPGPGPGPTPIRDKKKKKFPWIIYYRKLRVKRAS